MEDVNQTDDAAKQARLAALKRDGVSDRQMRSKARGLGWTKSKGSLDDFMFDLGWLRRGKGQDARWFKIER